MIAGHYGAGFIAKALNNAIPLWVLFLAVQLIDIFWSILILLKVERARMAPGITPMNPIDFYYMPYSHSLLAVILWSVAAALVASRIVTKRRWAAAAIIGAAVLSHWVLDLLVHRPILPLYGDVLKFGMGLYFKPALALALELALLFGGIYLYLRTTKPPKRVHRVATVVLGFVIAGLFGFVAFGPPLRKINAAATASLVTHLVLAGAAYWVERKRA